MKNKKTKLKVGDKVQCIDAVPRSGTLAGCYEYPKGFLKHGKIYTVSDIAPHIFGHKDHPWGLKHHSCLYLQEVPCFLKANGSRAPFLRYRFQKI